MVFITNIINKDLKKNFPIRVIQYQVEKLKIKDLGKSSEDANKLIELLELDSKERSYYFNNSINSERKLGNVCFMTRKK